MTHFICNMTRCICIITHSYVWEFVWVDSCRTYTCVTRIWTWLVAYVSLRVAYVTSCIHTCENSCEWTLVAPIHASHASEHDSRFKCNIIYSYVWHVPWVDSCYAFIRDMAHSIHDVWFTRDVTHFMFHVGHDPFHKHMKVTHDSLLMCHDSFYM